MSDDFSDLDAGNNDLGGFDGESGNDLGGGETPSAEKPFDDTPFDAGVEVDEESDPKKFIQQLSGKLGQSLRKYSDQNGSPDFELEKFAINSVISATHASEMEESDKDDIIDKIKSSGDNSDSNSDNENNNNFDGNLSDDGNEIPTEDGEISSEAVQYENFGIIDKEDKPLFVDAKLGVTESVSYSLEYIMNNILSEDFAIDGLNDTFVDKQEMEEPTIAPPKPGITVPERRIKRQTKPFAPTRPQVTPIPKANK